MLNRLPAGSREANLTLTTDNGTQFTSARFIETLNRLGITHRRTAYHHPEGNSYIERFHRSLKEEEVWTAEYRSVEEARDVDRSLDPGVQSRPAASRRRKSHSARSVLEFCSLYLKNIIFLRRWLRLFTHSNGRNEFQRGHCD